MKSITGRFWYEKHHTEGSHSSLSQGRIWYEKHHWKDLILHYHKEGSGMKSIIESDVKKGPPIESNHDVHMRNGTEW